MAYSSNLLLSNARAQAVGLVVEQQMPLMVAARKCGTHRTTLWRWKCKWKAINEHVQLTNYNRPSRAPGDYFRQAALRWRIPTLASRPRTNPKAIAAQIVARVLELRRRLKRCAEVVWHHITRMAYVEVRSRILPGLAANTRYFIQKLAAFVYLLFVCLIPNACLRFRGVRLRYLAINIFIAIRQLIILLA